MSDLRAFYKDFVEGEAGRNYLEWFTALEVSTQLEGYRAKTVDEKALAMAKLEGLYLARTHLVEMSQPKKESKKSSGG